MVVRTECAGEDGFLKKKRWFRIGCMMFFMVVCLLTGLGKMQWKESGAWEKTVSFGEGEEWENWTDYLLCETRDKPYACAFVKEGVSQAEVFLEFCEDRESLVNTFQRKKKDRSVKGEEEDGLCWSFVKLRLDEEIYGLDIYRYLQEHLSEEGYLYEAWSLNVGNTYAIEQENVKLLEDESLLMAKREAIIKDRDLYVLSCEDGGEDNPERVSGQLHKFEMWIAPESARYGCGISMDEEQLYWSDHTQRLTSLDNPQRSFKEVRALDLTYSDKISGYFPLMSEAKYQIRLARELPEMEISFRFMGEVPSDGYKTHLFGGMSMDGIYRMEIRNAQSKELIQEAELDLCMEKTDTVSFRDLDGDGYLEMRVVYHTHGSGYGEIVPHHERYWAWDPQEEELVPLKKTDLQARRSECGIADLEEENKTETEKKSAAVKVQRGDCLWRLARKYYGDGERWRELYERNRAVIGNDPSLILEGTELEVY